MLFSVAPPSSPVSVESTDVSSTSVSISWSLPNDDGGRTDLFFTVVYANDSFTSPSMTVPASSTQYTFNELRPSTEYTLMVIANNGVSDQDPDTPSRTTTINVTTLSRGTEHGKIDSSFHLSKLCIGPSSPINIMLSSTEPSVLQWEQPDSLYGTLQHYNIVYARTDNSSLAMVADTTQDTSFDLSTLNIGDGTFYFWVSISVTVCMVPID